MSSRQEWPTATLSECCEIISGSTPRREKPEYWGGDINWATPRDLSNLDRPVLERTEERITRAGLQSCSAKMLPKGAVLFSSRAPVGLVAIAGQPMCTNQGFKSLIPGPLLDSGYLYWFLTQAGKSIEDSGNGTTFTEVSKAAMERVRILLPPLAEQRRIADLLDRVDAVRRRREEGRRLMDELLRSVFLEMFGDPSMNPKGWPTRMLGEIGVVTTGNTPPRGNSGNFGTDIEWVKSDNLQGSSPYARGATEGLSPLGRQRGRVAAAGSILVTCIAGSANSIGNAALVEREVAFNQQINAISPFTMDPYFLLFQLRIGKRLIQECSTKGMKGLVSKSRFEAIQIMEPLPELQLAFRAKSLAVIENMALMDEAIASGEALLRAMQSGCFETA